MSPPPSLHALQHLRLLALRPLLPPTHLLRRNNIHHLSTLSKHPHSSSPSHPQIRPFSSTPRHHATLMQIFRQGRHPKRARRPVSPAIQGRPCMKAVCLKVGITKPKKPNSGQRKTAKIRLSSGKVVSAYIPGEGMFVITPSEVEKGV
ncbi:MAG: hypothetical protein Q9227_002745 [Pyrenula ochraceoflavens]